MIKNTRKMKGSCKKATKSPITEVLFFHFGAQTLYFSIRGRFGETHLGPPRGTVNIQKAFPCSAGLVPFCAGAFPCSVAFVFGFLTFPWVAQHGLSKGVRNMYKTNAFLRILRTNPERMARQKRRQRTKIFKKRCKN